MHVLVLRFDLRLRASRSLKEKRQAIRPIVDRLRKGFEVSVAETSFADDHKRAELGVALVSGSPLNVEQLADEIERFVWSRDEVEVLEVERTWCELD